MKILLEHHSNANLGDTAMIEGSVRRLTEVLPGCEIYIPDRPGLRTAVWGLPRVHRISDFSVTPLAFNLLAHARCLWRYNGAWRSFIFNATLRSLGTIHSAGVLPVHDAHGNNHRETTLKSFCQQFDALHVVGQSGLVELFSDCLFQQCCLILAFAEQRKPVIMTGQQLGPLPSSIYRKLVLRVLRKVDFVGLREPTDSVSICQEARVPLQCFEVMGDDSFGMMSASDDEVAGLLREHNLKENAFLAVNLRLASYAGGHDRQVHKVAALLDKVAARLGMPIVIVPISLNEIDSDIRAGQALRKALSTRDTRIVVDNENLTSPLIKGVLGKAFGAICVSYHACTFALSQGVPAICMYDGDYYKQKAQGICGFWEDPRLGIHMNEIDLDLAVSQSIAVFNDEGLRKKLRILSSKAVGRWQEIFDRRVGNIFDDQA